MSVPAPKPSDTPQRYSAHIDYVRNQAVVSDRSGTTFFSWGEGESTIRDIVTSRYGPDGGKRGIEGQSA